MRRLLAALLVLIGLAAPALAAGAEGILDFTSDITVNADSSLTVRETIKVDVEHVMINHGIDRDFPTTYTDRLGQRVRVGFEVLDVKRDGRPEPYAESSISNGRRLRIGDKDVIVETGEHSYQITYRTTRQLGFFKDYDELYWNVTGNGWAFSIDHAAVTVRLPPGASIVQSAAYTGYAGDQGTDFRLISGEGSVYRAETTRWLRANEGFTVAVAWPKGFVTEPTQGDRLNWWLLDNAGYFGLIATLLAALAFYLYAWDKVGRDPARGTIIPLFRPPEGLDPAAMRYVVKQGFDDRGFAAGVVGLAVKGGVRISEDESGVYTLTRLARPGQPLLAAEQTLFTAIPNTAIELKQKNHATISGMKKPLEKALTSTYDGVAFIRNLSWFWKGAALSAVGLIGSALLLPIEEGLPALMVAGWSAIWWGVIIGVGWGMVKGVIAARGVLGKIASLFGLMFLVFFGGAGIAIPTALLAFGGNPGMYAVAGAAVLLGIMAVTFYYLLRAPTVAGRKLLDQIEGFKMYLTTAEEARLNLLNPPEKTPQLFERYLPYAMALDCENEWNAKFATILAAAAAAGAYTQPSWYSGHHFNTGSFASDLGSSLSSSIASASTAPGSSSGSGGGGSSGGGGGGGGGGGW
jgi:uncharacterized membrane protein YgcG